MNIVAIAIIFLNLGIVWSIASSVRVADTVVEYSFLENECLRGIFSDISEQGLGGNMTVQSNSCLPSNGCKNEFNSLFFSASRFQNNLINSSSIEFWFNFNTTTFGEQEIFSVSDPTDRECSYYLSLIQISSRTPGNPGKIHASFDEIEIKSLKIGIFVSFCSMGNKLKFDPIYFNFTTTKIRHIVVQLSSSVFKFPGSVSIYRYNVNYSVDGRHFQQDQQYSSVLYSSSDWKDSSSVYLLSSPNRALICYGNLHYFAIYTRLLTEIEILQNYDSKFPDSLPVPISYSTFIQENGEVGDHSLDPMYYQSPILSTNLPIIQLQEYDLDFDPISPTYDIMGSTTQYFYLWTSSLTCDLYYLNGTQINNSDMPIMLQGSSVGIRYRPPQLVYSYDTPLLRLYYSVIDSKTHKKSLNNGSINVFVNHVDQPPVPKSSDASIMALSYGTLQLLGSDVDSAIVNTRIITLPKFGFLYLMNAKGEISRTISEPDVLLQYPAYISYYYSNYSHAKSSSGVIDSDCFHYSLYDVEGRESIVGDVNISITTPLFALPSKASAATPNAQESTCSTIRVYGMDKSKYPMPIEVIVTKLPRFGKLFASPNCNGSLVVENASTNLWMDSTSYSLGVVFSYLGNEYYFSSPTKTVSGIPIATENDNFYFKTRNEFGIESSITSQVIVVKNWNNASIFGNEYLVTHGISIYPKGSSSLSSSAHDVGYFSNFTLLDYDLDVDYIRVVVKSSKGSLLSFPSESVSKLDFSSFTYCLSNKMWVCLGSGFNNALMSFVASPKDALSALNSMYIESSLRNTNDSITITIYDGEAGQCLSNSALGSSSYRKGCYSSSTVIPITVYDFPQTSSFVAQSTVVVTKAQIIVILLALTVVLSALKGFYHFVMRRRAEMNSTVIELVDIEHSIIPNHKVIESRRETNQSSFSSAKRSSQRSKGLQNGHDRSLDIAPLGNKLRRQNRPSSRLNSFSPSKDYSPSTSISQTIPANGHLKRSRESKSHSRMKSYPDIFESIP